MKTTKKNIIWLGLILGILLFNSCDLLSPCKEINKSELLLLFDVSDEKLFEEIKEDLKLNFAHFMKQTNFTNIQSCQQAKMSLGTLSAKDELNIRSVTIGLLEKGLSKREIRQKTSPVPINNLVKQSLLDYTKMSKDKKFNNSTNILDTTIKAIINMDIDAQNTLVILSDMVVNNKLEGVNFYKKIPKDVKATVNKLIDPILKEKFNKKIEEGLELKVIIVLKEEPGQKVKKKDVKLFWQKAFEILQIDDVQFIDNLTNRIHLWKN